MDAATARRLVRLTEKRLQADAEWREAIREAHAAGLSLRKIAAEAEVSHVRVLQIVRNDPPQHDPTYLRAHHAVAKARGKPKECSACGLNDPEKIYDWASLTGQYDDVEDYARMCRKCHRAFDRERRQIVRELP